MANEITCTGGILANKVIVTNKTSAKVNRATEQPKYDWTGNLYIDGTQTIGTTYEAITTGDLGSAGWAYFINLDSTNFVEIGLEVAAAFQGFLKLPPGYQCGPMYLTTLSIFGRADTAAVKLGKVLLEA